MNESVFCRSDCYDCLYFTIHYDMHGECANGMTDGLDKYKKHCKGFKMKEEDMEERK